MDLTQAEAVIDLIHAETAEAAKNAAGQLGGAVTRRAGEIYAALTDISAHYHAVIDYPDEDIQDFPSGRLCARRWSAHANAARSAGHLFARQLLRTASRR